MWVCRERAEKWERQPTIPATVMGNPHFKCNYERSLNLRPWAAKMTSRGQIENCFQATGQLFRSEVSETDVISHLTHKPSFWSFFFYIYIYIHVNGTSHGTASNTTLITPVLPLFQAPLIRAVKLLSGRNYIKTSTDSTLGFQHTCWCLFIERAERPVL